MRICHLAALVLILVGESALWGATSSDEAAAEVRKALGAALEVVHAGGPRDESLSALRSVARGMLDTRAMGRRAIGQALAAQPPEQQEEYLELFDRLIVRAYLQKLLLFRDPRMEYGEPRLSGNVVMMPTKIVTSKDAYEIVYEMREHDGRWVATDVIVEGVSLTDNYRAQFSSLLRDRSFAELLDLMRSKTRPEEPM